MIFKKHPWWRNKKGPTVIIGRIISDDEITLHKIVDWHEGKNFCKKCEHDLAAHVIEKRYGTDDLVTKCNKPHRVSSMEMCSCDGGFKYVEN